MQAAMRTNVKVEGLESRILLSAPPEKFVFPVGGVPQVDWAVAAYTDRDPAAGVARDYRGRGYTFDGSDSLYVALPDFATMDAGIDVYAAAAGTVLEVHDGEFDRQTTVAIPAPAENYVLIDHGDGWHTRYGRLRNGSVTVAPGQTVAAGQRIGLVGGSGNPVVGYSMSDAHLRFTTTYNDQPVETFLDPASFWQSPPPFTGDAPGVHYMTTSDNASSTDPKVDQALQERLWRRNVFHPGERVWVYTKWHGLNANVFRWYRYTRPDGLSLEDTRNAPPIDHGQITRVGSVNLSGGNSQVGVWRVAAMFNGVELGHTTFVVADPSEGRPEIKVEQGDTYVVDGRTTPIDFGVTDAGAGPTRRTFTLINHGTAPLTLGQVTLPAGFSLASDAPASIPANGSQTLTIQMDDQAGGTKSGRVTIASNDAEQGEFDFAVKGVVTAPPPVVTAVHLSGSAWQPAFRDFIAATAMGSAAHGLRADDLADGTTLPWMNLDEIVIRYAAAPTGAGIPSSDTLSVNGQRNGAYAITSVTAVDPQTYVLRLAKPLGGGDPASGTLPNRFTENGDRVTVSIPGAGPGGTAYSLVLNVLQGDAYHEDETTPSGVTHTVNANDFTEVKRRAFRNTTNNQGVGTATPYTIFHDVDGNGTVNAVDFTETKRRAFHSLPAPAAPSSVAAAGLFSHTPLPGVRPLALLRPAGRAVLGEPPRVPLT